ncbi:MAG: hypothetical protein HY782_14970 [Chloroflexi bacterium]|nr:hypothetical protein [Chloroflexota bacterium]
MSTLFSPFNRRILFLLLTMVAVMLFAFPYSAVWNTQAVEEEENEAATIEEYFQWRFDQMKDKTGTIPDGALIKALNQRTAMVQQHARAPRVAGIDNVSWIEAGPKNVGGRIRSILPLSASTVLIGSVSGGLWKTTNCCSTSTTWAPIDDWMANLGISSLIMDPTNANVMYAGTGETSGTGFRGAGVFKSTDGGTTWTQLSSTNTSDWYFVNRLAISPDGANLLAATGTGLYHSTDGGATWTRRVTGSWRDVKFDPTNSNNAVAGGSGYSWYTTGGGASGWAAATFTPTISGRVELAYSSSNPSIVYASVNQNSGDVYKSMDGGHTYTRVNTGQQLLSSQGDYDNAIWVKPDDPNFVVVAGVDMYKSTDGGTTFTKIAYWGYSWHYREPPSPHADHHALVSIPGSNLALLNGNDGGIYYTADVTTAGTNADYNLGWVYMNNNLGITQFYGVAGNNNGVLVGGSQDNGATVYTPAGGANAWTYFSGGDGGKSAADPTNPNYLYNEYIYGQVHRSDTGGDGDSDSIWGTYWDGAAWTCRAAPYRIDDACNGVGSFIAPILLDPNNANRLFVGDLSLWVTNDARTPYVWNSPTGGPQWTALKASIGSGINAIAVAPSNSNVIWVGHKNSQIYMTTNGTSTPPAWTRVDTNIGAGNPGTAIGSIAIDKNNSNILYVGYWGYGANRLWRTADGGTTWTSITSNLPQVPIYAVAINPANSAWLYVGTEIGVFASTDTGATWNVPTGTGKNGDGPANVAVEDLQWMGGGNSTGSTILIAGTHGRGAFTADVTPPGITNTYADDDLVCAGNTPCYATIGEALNNVATGGTVTVYAGAFSESVSVAKNATVNVVGNIIANDVSLYSGATWNANSWTMTAGNVSLFGGTWNANSSTLAVNDFDLSSGTWNANSSTLTVNGNWTTSGTFNAGTGTVVFAKNGVVTVNLPSVTEGTLSFCNVTINGNTTVDPTDDFISAATGGSCTQFTQNGKLRREAPTQDVLYPGYDISYTFKDARNRNAVVLGPRIGTPSLRNTSVTITSNQQPPSTCGANNFPTTPVLRQYDIVGTNTGGIYPLRLYFTASNPDESNGNTVTAPYNLAIYHCNGTSWEKYAGTGGSDANGVYVEANVTFTTGSTFAIGSSGTYYYSQGSLDAGLLASWNTARGGGGSQPANFSDSDYFVIQNGHSMTTASALTLSHAGSLLQIESGGALTADTNNVSVNGAQIDAGGTLTINSGRTLTVSNGSRAPDLTVNGTLVNAGIFTMSGTASFGAGSVYQHGRDGGTIPTATWNVASTVNVTGITATVPGGLPQAFGNFTWNSTVQTATISFAGNLTTVNGNFTVTSTGSGAIRLTQNLSPVLNVGGNLIMNGGTFNLAGTTGNPIANVAGDVLLNGGTLRPSASTGTTTLNVAGDWTYSGGTFTPDYSTVNFTKNGVATVSSSATAGTLTFCNLTISANTTVDTTDDYISAATGGSCTTYTQTGKLRRETPTQNINSSSTFTFKDARNRDAIVLTKTGAGTDLGNTAVTVTSNLQPTTCGSTTLGGQPVFKSFEIAPTGSSPFGPYIMRLYFSASSPNEANGNTTTAPFNLAIYHCTGTTWQRLSTGATGGSDANGVYVQVPNVSSFSTFGIGGGPSAPTGVTLARLDAIPDATGITLEWQTLVEVNTSGFQLERALDGKTYLTFGAFIPARGIGGGALYSVRDTSVLAGQTVQYRLVEIAMNGARTTYGPITSTRPNAPGPIFLPFVSRP